MAKVQVFTTTSCSYCKAAKELLRQREIPFEEVILKDDDSAAWDELTTKSGMQTVPQIFHGENLIGGFQQLAELDRKDNLNSLKRG